MSAVHPGETQQLCEDCWLSTPAINTPILGIKELLNPVAIPTRIPMECWQVPEEVCVQNHG
jgi:hypothetical protein